MIFPESFRTAVRMAAHLAGRHATGLALPVHHPMAVQNATSNCLAASLQDEPPFTTASNDPLPRSSE